MKTCQATAQFIAVAEICPGVILLLDDSFRETNKFIHTVFQSIFANRVFLLFSVAIKLISTETNDNPICVY